MINLTSFQSLLWYKLSDKNSKSYSSIWYKVVFLKIKCLLVISEKLQYRKLININLFKKNYEANFVNQEHWNKLIHVLNIIRRNILIRVKYLSLTFNLSLTFYTSSDKMSSAVFVCVFIVFFNSLNFVFSWKQTPKLNKKFPNRSK